MKTIRKESVTPVYTDTLPNVSIMDEGIIYISIEFGVTGHRCLCGCGELTILPINNVIDGKDHGWKMTDKDGKLTFTPSVGNFQIPCKSHYIITNGIANFV